MVRLIFKHNEQQMTSFLLVEEENVEKYKCQICGYLMKEPIQTFRGNVACRLCYNIRDRDKGICPIDHQPITDSELFRDKAKEKEISRLECICGNHQKGCEWHGIVKEFENHHCKFITTECKYCHCNYMEEKEVDHFKECEGIYAYDECIFKDVGCTFKADTKADMEKHIREDKVVHILYQKKYREESEKRNNEIQKLNNELQKQNNKLLQEMKDLRHSVKDSNQKMETFQKQANDQFAVLVEMLSAKNNETDNKHEIKSNKIKEAEAGGVPMNTTSFTKEIENIVRKNVGSINDLDLRLQLHENTTYDGRMLWKIDQFTKRRQDAILGKITALHSAPCFTNQYGYKFCARLYMNGDGMGRGTHLSLFIVLMKSQYDNLLEWPFQKQVSFTLVNQVDQKKNIMEKLFPQKESYSFQKPVKDMNVASGCPLFANLKNLEEDGYVKDDCLFIETGIL